MTVRSVSQRGRTAMCVPVRMPWTGRDVPHAVIEINGVCNISCEGCYKRKTGDRKSLSQIRREMDVVAARRNLASITIAGGEPLLSENLPEAVSHAASLGVRPVVLTNGSLLTRETAAVLKRAGAARIVLHIDRHQRGRPDSAETGDEFRLNRLRSTYMERCEEAGLPTALQLTLYRGDLADFPAVVSFASLHAPRTIGILVTLYCPTVDINARRLVSAPLTNKEIIEFMAERLGMYPCYYIPSNRDARAFRWLFYTSFVTVDRRRGLVRRLPLDPRNRRALAVLPVLQRKVKGRYSFEDSRSVSECLVALLLYAALSFSARTIFGSAVFLAKGMMNCNLAIFTVLFQQGPDRLQDGGYEICRDCPDATIRGGRLVPVCLADHCGTDDRKRGGV